MTQHKVLFYNSPHDRYWEGTSDFQPVDKEYVRVHIVETKCTQILHSAFVILDTAENRKLLDQYILDYKRWKSQEPNVHAMLNKIQRRPK